MKRIIIGLLLCTLLIACVKIDGNNATSQSQYQGIFANTSRAEQAAACQNAGGTIEYSRVNGNLEAKCVKPGDVRMSDVGAGG